VKATHLTTSDEPTGIDDELVGFRVEGTDGTIGKVEHVTYNKHCIVVRTGPPLFRETHAVVARAVERVEPSRKRILVALSQEDVKGAPEYDDLGSDEEDEIRLEAYYRPILLKGGEARERPGTRAG
jgi:hypothetical protein